MDFIHHFTIWVLFTCFISQSCYGFRKYEPGDSLTAKVNSLTSIVTQIPYSYYTLPFCHPPEGVKDSRLNLGQHLMGDRISNSPYKFKMFTNQSEIFLCQTRPLSSHEYKRFTSRIKEMYQVNLILDDLPAIRYTNRDSFRIRWTGYPLGIRIQDSYYVFNHLKFTVLVHKNEDTKGVPEYMIVGFEVTPCSVNHNPNSLKSLKPYGKYPSKIACDSNTVFMTVNENEPVAFTYEVSFVKSDIKWQSRWDAYLTTEGAKVHWFSILNSLVVITFSAGFFLRTVRRELTRYEEFVDGAEAQTNEELSGWKLVVSDVFRAPTNPVLLCVIIGDGVQILGMAVLTIMFGAVGFISPVSRGTLVTGMVIFYVILGILGGYVAVRLWQTLLCGDHKGWVSVCWKVACFVPGLAFLILFALNFLFWRSGSTGAIRFSVFIVLVLLWFCVSVPLTFVGGYLGAKAPHIEYPVKTSHIPREIPPRKYPSWLLGLGAGILPFGVIFIQLYFIMSSIWMGRVYDVFGVLLLVLILLVVICAEVSLVLTYIHLGAEDWKWWWKSFFASGSVALYVFLYLINYLIFDLRGLNGAVSAMLYLGYSLLMVLAILLAAGTVGLLSSFWFVYYLVSSVKHD